MAFCGIAGAGLWLSALGDYALFALGFGGLFGLANGFGYSLSLQIVQRAPSEKPGLLTGLVVASYMAGSAIGSPLLSAMLGIWGLRSTMLALATVMLMAGLVVMLLTSNAESNFPTKVVSGAERPFPSALEFLLLWACFFFSSFVGMMVIAHAAPIVESVGGVGRKVALAATLVAVGNGIGRLAGGSLIDRLPAPPVFAGACALVFLALLVTLTLKNADAALLSLALVGGGYGCIASALPVAVGKRYGVAKLSKIYGRLFTAWGAAGLLGPLAGGLYFDVFGNYEAALITAAAAALMASLAGVSLRFTDR
jgi:OFA family oxalate/formate antiporter-like MFS transporter